MNKTTIFLLLTFTISFYGQYQNNAPRTQNNQKTRSLSTLQEISDSAELYFNTIDRNKKGSGYKPFKRWENHWSSYLKNDGSIAPASALWSAWREKKKLSKQNQTDNGQWKPLGPFENSNRYGAKKFQQTGQGRVNTVAVDPNNPNIYYVGSPAGGLWKSTDAGLNWTPLTDYLPQIGVSGIAIHPNDSNTLYIATGDDDGGDSYSVGVFKSTDGGNSWKKTGDIPGEPKDSTNEIYIHPNAPETVLVATNTGVQKTTNGGDTWTTKLEANIIDLKMKPGDPNIWYALSKNSFYKSSDGGETFKEITVAIELKRNSKKMTMDVTKANPNYVYIVSADLQYDFNGVYKSTNSGDSFKKTKENKDIFKNRQAWFDLALTVSSSNPDIVYVGVLDIWKSTNGGNSFYPINSWINYEQPSYTHSDIHFLRFFDDKLFAGTDGGVYVSTNEGTTFTDLTKNLAISQFYKIGISKQQTNTIAGGLQDNGGFGLSDKKWYNYHAGDGMEGVVNLKNPDIFYGFVQYGSILNVSENGGKTKSYIVYVPIEEVGVNDPGGRWVTPLSMNSSGELFAGFSQLYKLENRVWSKISDHNFKGDLENIEIDPNDDNFILVSSSFRLYRSTNKGKTFSIIPFNRGKISSIEISNTDANTAWITASGYVLKSTNIRSSNPTFTLISNKLPKEGKTIVKHHARSGNNTIYVGTTLGVYYTNDDMVDGNMVNWKTFDNGLHKNYRP